MPKSADLKYRWLATMINKMNFEERKRALDLTGEDFRKIPVENLAKGLSRAMKDVINSERARYLAGFIYDHMDSETRAKLIEKLKETSPKILELLEKNCPR